MILCYVGYGVALSGNSSDSTKNAAEHRSMPASKRSSDQSKGSSSHGRSTVRGGLSSQFGPYQLGSQINTRPSVAGRSLPSDSSASGSIRLQGNAVQSPLRRNQVGNANYLLNFHYDPISRPQPRAPPPRRPRKIKPYNKDLFLQANYKFIVLDTGSYRVESMDPDKMLQWEDIICVRYSTPFPVQCPICLETPLCPQITSCGHIYCFPCILRYILMGKEDHMRDCWKKCPLCFMMISSKDLSTIQIESVKQFKVGDRVNFTLLTRQRDSLVPSLKCQQGEGFMQYSSDGIHDSFSKFTLTSDVEMYVRDAKSDLSNWLSKAESGLVDDLERLPYVCAALEQLEERIKNWMQQPISSSSPKKNGAIAVSNPKVTDTSTAYSNLLVPASTSDHADPTVLESGGNRILERDLKHNERSLASLSDVPDSPGSQERPLLSDEDRASQSSRDTGEKDSYAFYQAIDGQHLILHPLCMKCLLHHYGSYDRLPSRISGKILEMEMLTQSEAIRKRYRFLSHLSLTTAIQFCEIDLEELMLPSSLAPFKDEIRKREKQRKQIARKERNDKARAEVAAIQVMPILYDRDYSPPHKDANFSSDDFEALGSSVVASTSPPNNGDRKLFSDVTRLGYAAAHDSPSLRADGSADPFVNTEEAGNASTAQGLRPMQTRSFANIMSAPKATVPPAMQNMNGLGKKGKKPTKVLLSTAGGRRY